MWLKFLKVWMDWGVALVLEQFVKFFNSFCRSSNAQSQTLRGVLCCWIIRINWKLPLVRHNIFKYTLLNLILQDWRRKFWKKRAWDCIKVGEDIRNCWQTFLHFTFLESSLRPFFFAILNFEDYKWLCEILQKTAFSHWSRAGLH